MPSIARTQKRLVLNEYYCEDCGGIWAEKKQEWMICSFCIQKKIYLNEEDTKFKVIEDDEELLK